MAQWDRSCDVLVVGSGAGGMMAAYTASREGLDITLIESTDKYGGTSAYSGGGMWLPCNAVLRRAGDDDTMESARAYYHAVVGDRTPRALQDAYLDTGARLIDYLEQDPGFAFEILPWPDYYGKVPHASATGRHIIPATLPTEQLGALVGTLRPALAVERRGEPMPEELVGGQALIARFLLALQASGNVALHLSTALESLVREGQKVTGAVLQTPEGPVRIEARRGIVLAAGGFERNAQMRATYQVPGTVAGSMAPPGNTGGAIAAGIAIGADTDLMDQAWWSPGLIQPDGSATFTLGFLGGIFVDDRGQRFMDESVAYDRAGRKIIELVQEGRLTLPFWYIYDNRDDGVPPILWPNVPFDDPAAYRATGLWRSAPTLAELAQRIDVPAEALEASVARFNDHCQRQQDTDFQRGDEPYERVVVYGQSPLVPITDGPFHAAAFALSDLGTKGGLRTDEHARVLDTSGAVLEGLYAAGNTMAAVSGEAYPGGGNPVGSSMVFGFLAAQHIGAKG